MSKPQTIRLKQSRNEAFDIARGIAIILMVIGHTNPPQVLHDFIYFMYLRFILFQAISLKMLL